MKYSNVWVSCFGCWQNVLFVAILIHMCTIIFIGKKYHRKILTRTIVLYCYCLIWSQRIVITVTVNVNVSVYSLKFPLSSADITIYDPGIGNSAFAHFAAAIANHYNLAFSFHQVPITTGWTEAVWYERLAQHLYTWPSAWPCATTVWELQSDHLAMSTRAAPH